MRGLDVFPHSPPHPDERSEEGSQEILRHCVPQDEPFDEKNSPRAQFVEFQGLCAEQSEEKSTR